MTAPSFVSAGTGSSGTASLTLPWGSGHQADDIGILVIETGGEGSTLTPSGWTHVTGSPVIDLETSLGSKLHVLWRRATSSAEADVSTGDSGDHQIGRIFVYRGCETSGDPWNVVTTGMKLVASTSVDAPAVTTTVADTLVLAIVGRPGDVGANQFSGWTNSNLSSITERADSGTTVGHGGGFGFAEGLKASAGNTGDTTATLAASDTNTYLVLALKPPQGAIAASGTSTTGGTAAPSVTFALAAVGVSASGGSAGPSVLVEPSATGLALSGGSASPSAAVTIEAAGLVQALGQAGASVDVLLQGAGAALTSGNTELAVLALQAAAGAAESSGQAEWAAAIAAQAAGNITTTGIADLAGAAGALFAAGGAASGGAGAFDITVALQAAGGTESSGVTDYQATVQLTAAGFIQSMGAGFLVVSVELEAFGAVETGGSAAPSLTEAPALLLIPSPGYIVRASQRDFIARAAERPFKVAA